MVDDPRIMVPVHVTGGRGEWGGGAFCITFTTEDAPTPHLLGNMIIGVQLKADTPSKEINELMWRLREYAEFVGVRMLDTGGETKN